MAKTATALKTVPAKETPRILPDMTAEKKAMAIGPATTIGQYVLNKEGEPKKDKRGNPVQIYHDIPVKSLPANVQAILTERDNAAETLKKLTIAADKAVNDVFKTTSNEAWKLPDGYVAFISRQWGYFRTCFLPEGSAAATRSADDNTDIVF